ncbi:MAG: hypothetical protein JRI47_03855, partial [Deltaproteobacteria bacterium]|nr:hypothetical protein [Deltaproteobacteria bacterium]
DKKQVRRLHCIENIDPAAQDVFDLSEAMKAVNGDRDLFNEIDGLFLESAAANMSNIQEGIVRSDASAV